MLDELITLVVPDVIVETKIRLIDCWIGRPRVIFEDGRRKQLVMTGQPHEIVVARNHPQFILFIPMHRVFGAQLAIVRIGISDGLPG